MGMCAGRGLDSSESTHSSEIDRQLLQDRLSARSTYKLLLLGGGESGKTTIAKQLKVLYGGGFEDAEAFQFIPEIQANVVESMRKLLVASAESRLPLDPMHRNDVDLLFIDAKDSDSIPITRLMEACKSLWTDEAISQILERTSDIDLCPGDVHYLNSLDRIVDPSYRPTEHDILLSRSRTTRLRETILKTSQSTFRMADVGGHRSDRKHWVRCFEAVDGLLFVVALSEYDQPLLEQVEVIRLHEALTLFDEICRSQWFAQTPIFLIFTKDDLFREKIQRIDLNVCFPQYIGGLNYETAINFIKVIFRSISASRGKEIYTSVITGTNTRHVEALFAAVRETLSNQLQNRRIEMG